jgi:hypothetical protein
METGVKRALLSTVALVAACLLVCGSASAQLVLGQYEDEAPLGTWNIFGAPSAPSVGLGGLLLAHAWDSSVSLTNPALLPTLPRLSISLTASYSISSLFRFSLVNTGVVSSNGNLSVGLSGIDHAGLAFRSGKWAIALAAAVPENYGRPLVDIESSSYKLTLDQTGYLRLFHAAIARRLPAGLSLGLGINLVTGSLVRTTVDQSFDLLRTVTITDDKRESYRGLYLNGGLAWEASGHLTAALVVRSPYLKKGKGQSVLRYEVTPEGTDILIDAEATNEYRQPWVFGAGCFYKLSGSWGLTADLAWFGWSRYEVTYFDEPLIRSFRNVVRAGAGVEYLAPAARMYGRSARIPFRLGFSFDPQPMIEPRSSYLAITTGTGLRWRRLAVDLSGSVGWENGSGHSLKARKIALSVSYVLSEDR